MQHKIIMGIICSILATTAYGESAICVKPTTTMMILDPRVNGTGIAHNGTEKTWSVQFDYGTISGISACVSDAADPNVGDPAKNQNLNPLTSTGVVCYCKIKYPLESLYVYSNYKPVYANQCASGCAGQCKTNFATNQALRNGAFRTIGTSY